jgi:pimeloyl-ACP methyl ester carboxylesterase
MKILSITAMLVIIITCVNVQIKTQNIIHMEPLKLQYKVTGEGRPLVLIPGGLTGSVSWDPFVPGFSDSNRILQFQLLNVQYGLENKQLPANYTMRMESEALAESLNEIGITTPVDFIGWSFGGFVLLDFALNHPHLIRTLTLIEPPAFWILKANGKLSTKTNTIMEFMKTLTGDITEKQLEEFMITVGFAPPGTNLEEHQQWNTWVKYRNSLRNSGHVVMHTDDIARLNNFESPVLLVKGTGSAGFLHDIIEILGQFLPQSRTVELAGGHAPHIVSGDEFLSIIRKFHEEN